MRSYYFIQSFFVSSIGGFCLPPVDAYRMGANLKSDSTDCISASVTSVDVFGGILLP
ncbi:hypothetical protein HanXRQr2_Chr01g0016611 [Helianthus annuus]|uniref:Uncharacterized protein n=1 Tax=Helianthus annuus TaxID=4232 RepID=A0A9K3P363_HELAN|nr:hypothetical protein HanXRQr2_Chr01g0016611 [Helianthus annuus]KAJ0956541.1 hypothetical protein HanPSC8_Chr01g0016011 [Helianthus annuus]